MTEKKMCFLYVVECRDKTLYTGISYDVRKRIMLHNAGRGAAYTAARRPVDLMAVWQFDDRPAALRAEIAFKKLSRQTKLFYIMERNSFHQALFVSID